MYRFKPLIHAAATALAVVALLATNAELTANEPSATTMPTQPAESETTTSQPPAQTEATMAVLGAGVAALVAGRRLQEDIATY